MVAENADILIERELSCLYGYSSREGYLQHGGAAGQRLIDAQRATRRTLICCRDAGHVCKGAMRLSRSGAATGQVLTNGPSGQANG
jgi:hypothetical protein